MPIRRRDAVALLLVVAALVWLARPRAAPLRAPPLPAAGAEATFAPAFSLPRAGGGVFSLDEARGRATLVHFWATWCPPCREELPTLARLADAVRKEGLLVVAVSVDAHPESAERFARALALPFPVLLDVREEVARRYGVGAYPTTVVLDRAGRVVQRAVGAFAWDAPEAVAWLRALASGDGVESLRNFTRGASFSVSQHRPRAGSRAGQ